MPHPTTNKMQIAISYDILQKKKDWKTFIPDLLIELGHKVDVYDIRNKSSLYGYDLHIDIDSSTNIYIKHPDCKTIYWCFDAFQTAANGDFLRSDFYINRCKDADIVWSASGGTKNNLLKHNINSEVVLPGYIDFNISPVETPKHLISYIGGIWWFNDSICGGKNKTQMYLELIKKRFSDKIFISNGIDFKNVYSLYNNSYVVFNHTTCGANHLSNRVYEALSVGACLFTNYVPDLDLMGLVDGRDYLSYDNERSFDACLNFIEDDMKFNNGEKLREIGNFGKKKIKPKFSSIEILRNFIWTKRK